MIKSVLVALALVTAGAGGAFAAPETINVWGARIDIPTFRTDATDTVGTDLPARGARFMALRGHVPAHRDNNAYDQADHAR